MSKREMRGKLTLLTNMLTNGGGTGGGRTGAQRRGSRGDQRQQQQQRRSEAQSPQQLREWLFLRGASGGNGSCPYVIRTGDRAGQTCGRFHTQNCCFSRPDDAWRAEFGDEVERPRWAELLRSGVAIFDLDFDAILITMYALSLSAEGASESGLPGTAPAEALHTFTLDSGALRCFFRDSTTLTPLPAPVPVRLADPSGGPVVARSSTVLLCPAVPSGSLSVLHIPSFSTNFVSTAALQDSMVTTTTPGGQRVSIYTFTRRPGSSPVAPPFSCHLLSHQTLLWHHRLGNPSLPRLHGMHSRLLVSGLPRSLPALPPSPAPPCLPCVEVRQRAAPHSSFPPTTAPLQTLHMDVWGPARVTGQGRERYFLLVADGNTRYTTVFPLHTKGQVVDVLIPWIRAVPLQLRERFRAVQPVVRLHSERGGEFSSDLLRDCCRGEGILQPFTLPASPQQNGIAECRIGLVMEVARTSMIHAAAPHFLWSFAVRYAAHQLNLWPRVSLLETSPTLRWTGEVGDASVFRGPAPSGVSQVDPLPGTMPVEVADDSSATRGTASGGAESGGAEPGGTDSEDAGSGGAAPRGEEPGGAEPGGAECEGVEPGGANFEGAESGGAESLGAASFGGPASASPRLSPRPGPLSPQQLREWLVRRACLRSGAAGAGASGDIGAGGAGFTAGAGGARGTAVAGPGGARTRGTGAAGTGGVGGAGAGGARGTGAGDTVRQRSYFVPLLHQILGDPSSPSLTPPLRYPPLDQSQLPLQPAFSLPAPSPYIEQSGGLTERREPVSHPVSPVRTARRVPRSRPPSVPGTHSMALRPSSVPLRVPLPPCESSLPTVPDLGSHLVRAACLTVSRLLATVVAYPSFESAAASALVAELLDFAASWRIEYATSLVAESDSASPPSIGGECALGTDVLEDKQEDFECLAAAVPRFASMLLAPEGDPDASDIPTPRSYAKTITGP
ncbi:unnamed protein product [Closterium sp. NIES-54]